MLTVEQRVFLAGSAEFRALLAADPVLDELERSRNDRPGEFALLLEVLGLPSKIGALAVGPLTAALWAFLRGIGNGYAGDAAAITESDTEVFLHLLSCGLPAGGPAEIAALPARASGWCAGTGLDYPEAAALLLETVRRGFRPLELLPKSEESSESPEFDADWLVRIGLVAARESGEPLRRVLFEMPLSLVCFCFVNRLRASDDKGLIRRRASGEIAGEIVRRADFLGEEFLRSGSGEAVK